MRKTKTIVRNLENQVGQLATNVGRLSAQALGKILSQMVQNPRKITVQSL